MNCPMFPTKWFFAMLAVLAVSSTAMSAGTQVGNYTATSAGNRSGGANFWYAIRLISPMTGTIDSLGGWYRDANPSDTANGDDSVVVVVYSNSSNAPSTFLDSTAGPILVNNSSSSTYTRYAKAKTVGATINTGDTLWIATWVRAANNGIGLARDGDNTSDYGTFQLDSIRLSNSADAPPLASPAAASSYNIESAHCVFLVVSATTPATLPTTLKGGTYKQVTIK